MARNNDYEDRRAERAFREALVDLGEAERAGPAEVPRASPKAPAGEAARSDVATARSRVERKLSEVLTRMGRREKQGGDNAARFEAEEALGLYEEALGHFREAEEADASNAAAWQGEKETLAAMEQLHMREGRRNLEEGIAKAETGEVRSAARALTGALRNFESALAINPVNPEAEQKAAEARQRLPDVLTRLAQLQQQAGERGERESAAAALPHYEEAETSYQDALQLDPKHEPARRGQEEVEAKLASLREQLAREVEPGNQPGPPQPGQEPSLGQLLGEVQNPDRERQREMERQRQAAQNRSRDRKVYPDW
jgi:tetratricopeptide (TPR) repeat protein